MKIWISELFKYIWPIV